MSVSGVFSPFSCVYTQQKAQTKSHQSLVSSVAFQALEWVKHFFSSLKAIVHRLVVNLHQLRFNVTTQSYINEAKDNLKETENLLNKSKMNIKFSKLFLPLNVILLGCLLTYTTTEAKSLVVSYMNNSCEKALNAYPLSITALASVLRDVILVTGTILGSICLICTWALNHQHLPALP